MSDQDFLERMYNEIYESIAQDHYINEHSIEESTEARKKLVNLLNAFSTVYTALDANLDLSEDDLKKIFTAALGDRGTQYVAAYSQALKSNEYDAKKILADALVSSLEYAVYVQTKHLVRDAAARNGNDPNLPSKLDNLKSVLQDSFSDVGFKETLVGIGVKQDAAELLSSTLFNVSNYRSLYGSSAAIAELLDTMAEAVDDIKTEIGNRTY